jgi:hypothetical protein
MTKDSFHLAPAVGAIAIIGGMTMLGMRAPPAPIAAPVADTTLAVAPHPVVPSAPTQWWSLASSLQNCYLSKGPAARLDNFSGTTDQPRTQDTRDRTGALYKVEISVDAGDGNEEVWTYYTSQEACENEKVNASKNLANKYR